MFDRMYRRIGSALRLVRIACCVYISESRSMYGVVYEDGGRISLKDHFGIAMAALNEARDVLNGDPPGTASWRYILRRYPSSGLSAAESSVREG